MKALFLCLVVLVGQGSSAFASSSVMMPEHLDLSDISGADVPVIVEYTLENCGLCELVGPTLDDVAHDFGRRVEIYSIDSGRTLSRHAVNGYPEFEVYVHGHLKQVANGNLTYKSFVNLINYYTPANN